MDSAGDDIFQTQRLTGNQARRTYLVTYSQADLEKIPTRECISKLIVEAFRSRGDLKAKPLHWACCQEDHADGGKHYHLCIKLSQPQRWKAAKSYVAVRTGIILHFSSAHDNYYAAYKYVTKTDEEVFHSPDHPNLVDARSPKTKTCIRAFREKSKTARTQRTSNEQQNQPPKKQPKLSNLAVHEFLIANKIKRKEELFAIAREQREEGKKDLASFVLSRSAKSLDDLIQNTWMMESSAANLEREKKLRMELIESAAQVDCSESCGGLWYQCAYEVLSKNRIQPYVYADSVRNLLIKGRGKFRNIIIVGPANCGKTFLLRPLDLVFKTFCNPAVDKYAWVGADGAECIFLNDFRWSRELIAWDKLLLLLEGHVVKLPAPKNHFSTDVCIDSDVPVFATSIAPVTYQGRSNATNDGEDEMMAQRWRVFELDQQIPQEQQIDIPPCATCFSKLVLLGKL